MNEIILLQQVRRNSAIATCIGCVVLCGALDAHAQTGPGGGAGQAEQAAAPKDDPPPIEEVATADIVRANLETSYLAYPFGISGLPPLIFECSLAPHFFVHTNDWPFAIVLTPKVVLRMFNERSTPVRSPSFMPRIAAFLWFQPKVSGNPAFYGSVTLSHHSNGQAGPFFAEDGSINHVDGSFSTNYFEFAAYATGFAGPFLGWSSIALQWHPGFNEDPELEGRYGLMRIHLASTLVADLPLHGQVNARVSAILDDFQRASNNEVVRALERFAISLSYSMTVPGIDLGIYLGYYAGHDYYNIWFDHLIHTAQIGIAGGFAPTLLKSERSD